jgi:hypothetical protein
MQILPKRIRPLENKSTEVGYLAVCSASSHPPRGRTLARHPGSTSDRRPKRTVRDQHYFAAKCSKRGAVCKGSWRLLRSNSKAKAPRAKNKSKLGIGSCMARTQLRFDGSRRNSRTSNVSLGLRLLLPRKMSSCLCGVIFAGSLEATTKNISRKLSILLWQVSPPTTLEPIGGENCLESSR